MQCNANTDDAGNDTVKDKRVAVLDEVEKLRQEVKSETGQHLGFIKANINRAEEDLLNDGEYNYNVRLALTQLTHAVEGAEGAQEATVERIEKCVRQLDSMAELPAPDQIKR